jgi:hypothetical protein
MAKKKESTSFPKTDNKFNNAFQPLMDNLAVPDPESSDTVNPSWQRLGLDDTTVYTPLLDILGDATQPNSWLYVYPLEKGRSTHTGTLKDQKNDLKKAALAIIRPQRLILKALEKANPGFLTANDKKAWFINDTGHISHPSASLLTTNVVPVLSIYSIKYLQHVIDARNPETPNSTGFPEGLILLEISRFVGSEAPTDPSQYTHLLFSGKFRNRSTFAMSEARQVAWYIARYISPTGQVSNWSTSVSATIA